MRWFDKQYLRKRERTIPATTSAHESDQEEVRSGAGAWSVDYLPTPGSLPFPASKPRTIKPLSAEGWLNAMKL